MPAVAVMMFLGENCILVFFGLLCIQCRLLWLMSLFVNFLFVDRMPDIYSCAVAFDSVFSVVDQSTADFKCLDNQSLQLLLRQICCI